MLGTNELMSLYKAERVALFDPLVEESFPSFAQWRAEYEADARHNYRTVTVDEADKLMDSLATEAMDALETTAEDAHSFSQPSEERTMNTEENKGPEQNESTETTATTPAAAEKPARKRKAKTEGAAKAKGNKTTQARAIYKSMSRGKTVNRQKVLEKFMKDVGLSKAGASTYFQKFKTEFEASKKKAS